jgi:hypothetical protein
MKEANLFLSLMEAAPAEHVDLIKKKNPTDEAESKSELD